MKVNNDTTQDFNGQIATLDSFGLLVMLTEILQMDTF